VSIVQKNNIAINELRCKILECDKVIKSGCALRIRDLALNGEDLLSLGYRGKEVGKVLNSLLDHVLEYPVDNTPEILKTVIRKENNYEK